MDAVPFQNQTTSVIENAKQRSPGSSSLVGLEMDLCYRSNRDKVALAIVFNFEKFDDPEFVDRTGSEQDVERLVEVFKQKNVDIDESRIFKDKTRDGVKQELDRGKHAIN